MKTIFKRLSVLTIAFLFFNCSSDSTTPCVPISCLNGGTSTPDCGCDCPQGYSGTNCSTVVQPSKVIITKVVVKSFPNTNSQGFLWDGTNDADIYIKINSGTTVIYNHPSFFSNALGGSNLNYQFSLNPNLQITNVNSPLIFSLWDYDTGDIPSNADDNMASAAFLPFNGTSFPSVVTVTDPTSPTTFELTLSYVW
ncbi:hypothetical protein [Flavobacterium sp.]|jgi:hypothetical protein|uniref:hypothetical protein n=1 Tax=Flavobacterium sp. TaxID=239 RepID=UPI0037BE9770